MSQNHEEEIKMSDDMDIDDHLEGSNGTGVLIPQAQIMEVLHNLNVSSIYFYT